MKFSLSGIAAFIFALAVTSQAQATPVTLNFPSTQSTYYQMWEGTGTVPSGYRTPALYEQGDYVRSNSPASRSTQSAASTTR